MDWRLLLKELTPAQDGGESNGVRLICSRYDWLQSGTSSLRPPRSAVQEKLTKAWRRPWLMCFSMSLRAQFWLFPYCIIWITANLTAARESSFHSRTLDLRPCSRMTALSCFHSANHLVDQAACLQNVILQGFMCLDSLNNVQTGFQRRTLFSPLWWKTITAVTRRPVVMWEAGGKCHKTPSYCTSGGGERKPGCKEWKSQLLFY